MKLISTSLPAKVFLLAVLLRKAGTTSALFLFLFFICHPERAFAQNRIHVNAAATGANSGQSWADAFQDLKTALQTAQEGDTVWVAEGTYLPTDGTNRDSSFRLRSGVRLYGGFAGTEAELAERDWQAHPTVLSGDIGVPGDSTDNAYTILYMENPDSMTVVDGFVLRFGNAASPDPTEQANSPRRSGGAMYIMGADGEAYPTIRNCRFERNYALKFGGAVYINGTNNGSVAPMFLDCVFERNTSGLDGGAVYRKGSSWVERTPDFGGCTFVHNSSTRWAGGLYYEDAETVDTFQVWNTTFISNDGHGLGGAALLSVGREMGSKIDVQRCVFQSNYGSLGAALCLVNIMSLSNTDFIHISDSKFIKNAATSSGAVIYAQSFGITTDSEISIEKCSFIENISLGTSSVIFAEMSIYGSITMSNSNFIKNDVTGLLDFSPTNKSRINNCKIIDNAFYAGMFSLFKNNDAEMSNVIISRNTIASSLGYLLFIRETTLKVSNSIIEGSRILYQDVIPGTPAQSSINISNSILSGQDFITYEGNIIQTSTQISNCLLDGANLNCANLPPGVTCGPGNLFGLDPMFRDTAAGDYSLLPCSPLINAGSNPAAANIPTDLAGNPRILGGTVDIGAYESPAFALAALPAVQPACTGASNGSISVSPAFGCEPYTYSWQPSVGDSAHISNLPPLTYFLTVTDGSGRQVFDTVAVPLAPAPLLSLAAQDLACGSETGGSITATVGGGTPPFHYSWLPSVSDSAHASQLSPGAYALTLSDANGCLDSASAVIALIGSLTPMVGGTPISCHSAADGRLSAMPANGAPPFSWLWQGWAGTDSIAQPLGPGNYSVTVSDAYGCTFSFAFQPLTDPDSLWLTAGHTDNTDTQMPNGTAVVTTTSGGTPFPAPPPYTYSWSTGETGHFITGLPEATYTVTVTDSRG
ncbi:MAG: choice-of-anchor Q domain-containing protein, partial [Saprospiraceae bacterium]